MFKEPPAHAVDAGLGFRLLFRRQCQHLIIRSDPGGIIVSLVAAPLLHVEYDLPLWSQEHWKLIARSMEYLNEVGSRVVHVPLISYSNFGNAESMVRWISKGQDKFDYDFSVMDRYLDIATEHMGRPKIVVFTAWDIYLVPGGGQWTDDWWSKLSEKQMEESIERCGVCLKAWRKGRMRDWTSLQSFSIPALAICYLRPRSTR